MAELENITESLQRHVGIQQAQTFEPEDVSADAIATLLGERGDLSTLKVLWGDQREWSRLVDGQLSTRDVDALKALREVLESGFVNQWTSSGAPKTFRPLSPRLITSERTSSVFRDFGRAFVSGVWRRPAFGELADRIGKRVATWSTAHPLALLLAPLCEPRKAQVEGESNWNYAIGSDELLAKWIDRVVTEDWWAWLDATQGMSAEEQLESMTALIALHMHVAMLWRLGWDGAGRPRINPTMFIAVSGPDADATLGRGAYNTYGFWRDRTGRALRLVASQAVDKLAALNPEYAGSVSATAWQPAAVWTLIEMHAPRTNKRLKSADAFTQLLGEKLREREASLPPQPGEVRELIIETLVEAFSAPSAAVHKLKDALRRTGMAAGVVGPRADARRKRYQLDERGLDLLARLHTRRPPERIQSTEEEKRSVGAFLDDIYDRYGLIITTERESIQRCLESSGEALRPLRRHLPGESAMQANVLLLERRLDALRLVRRYSDASAVLVA